MLKQFVAGAAVAAALAIPAAQAQTGLATYVGEIRLLPYEKCPREWIEPEGQVMAISRHSALYRLLGTRFGGDGQISFNLPDLRDAVPERGLRYCMSLQGAYPALR